MTNFILVSTLLCLVFCLHYSTSQNPAFDEHWDAFTDIHNKTYDNEHHENKSRENFEANMNDVIAHNMNDSNSYQKGINKYSDMAPEELIKMMCKNTPGSINTTTERNFLVSKRNNAPSSYNWVDKGAVTAVKDQGQCGSCTHHAVVQAVEGATYIKRQWNGAFSVQQLIDCGNGGHGCEGGNNEQNYDYLKTVGLEWEGCYPYAAKDQTCKYTPNECMGAYVKDYVRVTPYGDEEATKQALVDVGPLSIGVCVSDSFAQYKNGVYNGDCSGGINHAVLLVGYGDENGISYWLIKNSWGSSWGDKGYIKIARNSNNKCSVATDVSYPIIW